MAVNRSRALRVAWMGGPTPPLAPPRSGTGWPTDAPPEATAAPPAAPADSQAAPAAPAVELDAATPEAGAHRSFEEALRPGDLGHATQPAGPRIVRVALVEDVAEVTHHIRDLLRTQPRFRLVHVSDDGKKALDQLADVNPDVVIVDSLLQGRTSSRDVVDGLRERNRSVGIVAITVPDHPLDKAVAAEADAVVAMPFGQVELARGIGDAFAALMARDPSSTSRIVTLFSPKGGVGTTTIAYNVAVALAETGLRTVLVDGGLQFAGLRRMLLAGAEAPSIMDLPTFELREADVADTVVQLVGGVDALLAPPRPEMADLIARRDIDQMLEVLRRSYQAIVIDTASALGDATLAFLDAADLVLGVVTPEPAAADAMRAMTETFAVMGFRDAKVQLVVNDRDRPGAVSVRELAAMVGREPAFSVASDGAVVAESNARGAPFVLARPDAPVSADVRRMAASVRAMVVTNDAGIQNPRVAWRH